jgi:serine/threonine protein kinase/ketosteroid isomerase-like protein
MKLCPTCQHCYEDTDTVCTQAEHDSLVAGRPGTRLIADKYRLDALLARGGMGAVYSGTHTELDRPIAIKLLLPDFNTDPKAFERFRREARAAARIKHVNVADIYDYGDSPDGEAFIVMELVEGPTLQERIRQTRKLTISEAVNLSRQIAEGMEAAHLSGVVHRDLKPSNIILTCDHEGKICVKLIDFGIAKISQQLAADEATLTATGTLVGTPRYMSPEQCLGNELDERSDIYSFGVILYEMLAGQAPFDATSAVAIALKHLHEPPTPLEKHRQDVPPLLANLITDTLSVKPEGRPQTAAELKRRLAEVAESFKEDVAGDRVSQSPLVEEVDELSRPMMPQEEPSIVASEDEYATQIMEEKKPEPLFGSGYTTIQQAVPLTPILPPADADVQPVSISTASNSNVYAQPVSTSDVSNTDETRVRPPRRQPGYIYAGIIIAFIIGAIALWSATRRTSPAPEASTASTAAVLPSPTNQPRVSEVTNPPVEKQDADVIVPATEVNESGTEQERAEIAGALNDWVAATNAGNVDRQMMYYGPTVEAFYRARNVSRDAVRAEKERVFDQADRIEVQAGEPQIKFSEDGQTASTRFRKRYVIEGPEENRRGEVMQELRWIKTDGGWKIISERDVQVLRNSNRASERRNNNSSNRPDKVVVKGFKKIFQVIR